MSKNNYIVPALEKAVRILDYLEENEELTSLSDISKQLEIPKSTVFRILKTLEKYHFIEQDKEKALFSLGPKLLSLANSARKDLNLIKISLPYLEELTRTTGLTSKLGVLKDEEVLVVNRINSNKDITVSTNIGSRFPIHAGASSKILLASLPDNRIDQILFSSLERYTENTITDKNTIKKMLKKIRKNGYAEDKGEYLEGIRALACPVYNYENQIIAAVSLVYLNTVNSGEKKEELLIPLRKCADSISKAMGYNQ